MLKYRLSRPADAAAQGDSSPSGGTLPAPMSRPSGGNGRPVQRTPSPLGRALPGVALCTGIAGVATALGHLAPVVGAAVIAIVLGIVLRNSVRLPVRCTPGVRVASKLVLQVAIAVLGAGLSLRQVWTTGTGSLVVLLGTLMLGIPTILLLGRLFGVDRTLSRLIGVGTGICGASAIGALAPILDAEEGAIAYAIATIFLFNVAGVLLFPPLGRLFGFSAHGFGLWAGTAINDTSSVVAAGYSFSASAGSYAVVVKLTRTLMIVPVSLIFAAVAARERRLHASTEAPRAGRARVPRFISLVPAGQRAQYRRCLWHLGSTRATGARTVPHRGGPGRRGSLRRPASHGTHRFPAPPARSDGLDLRGHAEPSVSTSGRCGVMPAEGRRDALSARELSLGTLLQPRSAARPG